MNPDLIPKEVLLQNIQNISIGENTYLTSGRLIAGYKSKIYIGKSCAIGADVSINARTHDPEDPVGKPSELNDHHIEKDIIIGDYIWIGSNVYIREGVIIGNNVIIGANSVVTKSFSSDVMIAGVPARIIKYKRNGKWISNKRSSPD